MKKSLLLLTALLAIPAFAAGKLKAAGNISPGGVVEKDGIYTVVPQGKNRIQLFPEKGYLLASENMELEIIAEVYGSGDIELGMHLYAPPLVWKGAVGSKIVKVNSENAETVKTVLTVNKSGINRALPFISVYSGEVKVKNLTARYKNGLDKSNAATAPSLPQWKYNYANAVNCTMTDNVLKITTIAGQMTEMFAPFQAAKAGDKIKFNGSISGKGKVSIGLHLYDKSRTWQGTVWKAVNVDGEVTTLPELTVSTPKGKKAIVAVRPVIRINANSDVSFKDISTK